MEFWDFISQPAVIWFLIGLFLLLLEFAMPGLIVMFFGIGAWVTALCCIIFDIGINMQLIIFIVTSLFSLIFLRRYFKRIFVGKGEDALDETLEEFIGKTAVALDDISQGNQGKIQFKGTHWEAEALTNVKKGDKVKIVAKESILLKIQSIN